MSACSNNLDGSAVDAEKNRRIDFDVETGKLHASPLSEVKMDASTLNQNED